MQTFASIVHEYFDDIAASHCMRCVEEQEFHVRYENDQVSFGVGWDRLRSYEIGLAVRLKSIGNDYKSTFELETILRFQGAIGAANDIEVIRAENLHDLRASVMKLAQSTREYAPRFLEGDMNAFASISAFRQGLNAEYNSQLHTIGDEVRDLYQKADAAWQTQDYKSVLEIYRSISFPLPPFARERLAIAERNVAEDSKRE